MPMKKINALKFVIMLSFFFLLGLGCKKDNTTYKPVRSEKLILKLDDLRIRVEQYDLGDMTPMDAKFSTLICGNFSNPDKPLAKEMKVLDTMIVDGVIKTANFGEIYVSLHGNNSYAPSGLYDGTLTRPDYFYNDMEQRFYMTDHQVSRVLDYLKSKTE
jgi:hypothetical protein